MIFISLLLITCIALSSAIAFAFLFFFSNPSNATATTTHNSTSVESKARALAKLDHPVLLLVSSDGFRFGYQFKTPTSNIGRLIANGIEAEQEYFGWHIHSETHDLCSETIEVLEQRVETLERELDAAITAAACSEKRQVVVAEKAAELHAQEVTKELENTST